jgi:hypothetical protein
MRTREATIHAEESYAAAGTGVYPIRETDPISRILIPFGVTVGAAARLAHHAAALTKIEIVDGSDVLFSLTGRQTDGIARFDGHGSAGMWTSPSASITEYGNLVIDFGRYLYDKEVAFDPTKFKNPQIKITRSLSAAEATCTAVILAIHAYCMEGLTSSPAGFLMKKEIKSWTAAAAAWEYTEMPKDYMYRRLFLQGLTATIGVGTHWSRARLSENNDKSIPFDVLVDDQIANNARQYGDIVENCSGAISAVATPFFAAPAYGGSVMAMCTMATNALEGHNRDGGQYEVKSANGTDDFRGIVMGLAPQGLVAFDMGAEDKPEDWYDPKALGSLQLEVLGAGAYTVRVIGEQFRTY